MKSNASFATTSSAGILLALMFAAGAEMRERSLRSYVLGYFKSERLVNLAKHNYSLEPNVTFSPDMKWIVFRSNMLGPTHVFAVEIAKSANH